MNKEEREKKVKDLSDKWVGKLTPDESIITCVHVDYRLDHQYMNRVEDEYGNIWFIEELEKGEDNEEDKDKR